jgi:hypothetical protein
VRGYKKTFPWLLYQTKDMQQCIGEEYALMFLFSCTVFNCFIMNKDNAPLGQRQILQFALEIVESVSSVCLQENISMAALSGFV